MQQIAAEIIFHVKRLTQKEWNHIFKLSFPIIIIEEIMKLFTRCKPPPFPPSFPKPPSAVCLPVYPPVCLSAPTSVSVCVSLYVLILYFLADRENGKWGL